MAAKEKSEYTFSKAERSYFDRLQSQYQASVSGAMQLVINQQELPGNWRMKGDGSGIERADLTPPIPGPMPVPLPAPTPEPDALAGYEDSEVK